jgi:hypothetical protein
LTIPRGSGIADFIGDLDYAACCGGALADFFGDLGGAACCGGAVDDSGEERRIYILYWHDNAIKCGALTELSDAKTPKIARINV